MLITFRLVIMSYIICYLKDHYLIADLGPPKSTQTSVRASSANPPAQKPAAYRPPHAKGAAAIQAQVHNL